MRAEDVHIDLEEMEKWKKKNAEERLKFIEMYAEWVRKNSNITWSKQQNMLINSQIHSAKQWAKKK